VFGGFSCVMGHIWRARQKHAAAWPLFRRMLRRWPESFLTTKTWGLVRKKTACPERARGEGS